MSRKLLAATAFFLSTSASASPLTAPARVTGNVVPICGGKSAYSPECSMAELEPTALEVEASEEAEATDESTVTAETEVALEDLLVEL